MQEESIVCQRCTWRSGCHPKLAPEYIKSGLFGFKTVEPLPKGKSNFCRHHSCVDGQAAAWEAMKNIGKFSFLSRVQLTSGESETCKVAEFGTKDKPRVNGLGRVVSEDGRIFSNGNDGVYYDTGRFARPYKEP